MTTTRLLLLLLLLTVGGVMGRVEVNVSLGSFTASGIRCDWFKACDFKFNFCVDDALTSSGNRMTSCAFASRSTGRMGAAPISFYNKLAPITFQMDTWKDIRLKVKVFDHDEMSQDDEIDFLFSKYVGPVGRRMATTMNGKTRMTVTFTSSCASNYYGPQCNAYCTPQNSALFGHYFCNAVTGAKICRPGWKGIDCKESAITTTTPLTTTTLMTTPTTTTTITTNGSEPPPTQLLVTSTSSNVSLEGSGATVNGSNGQIFTSTANIEEGTEVTFQEDRISNFDDFIDNVNLKPLFDHQPYFDSLNHTPSWLCGKVNLVSRGENNTWSGIQINFTKISQVEEIIKLSGNVSLSVSLDQQIQCNGSLVDAYLVDYCWNSGNTHSQIQQIIRHHFNMVFGVLFDFLHKEFCFTVNNNDSTSEIMYSIWGSLLVLILLVAIAAFVFYKRRKRCHSVSSDAKFMFQFRKAPANDEQVMKINDDKVNILTNTNCRV